MILKKVRIKNYRSIEDITLDVSHNCLTFIGINGTGKTNILKAISVLSENECKYVYARDCKIPATENYEKKDSEFTFEFELSNEETTEILSPLFERDVAKPFGTKEITDIAQIIPKKIIIRITYDKQNKREKQIISLEDVNIHDESFINVSGLNLWRVRDAERAANRDNVLQLKKPLTIKKLSEIRYVDPANCEHFEAIKPICNNLDRKLLIKDLKKDIESYVEKKIPNVKYWKYEKKYLITEAISIDGFAARPDTCIPLKNIFNLTGIKNIREEINNAKSDKNAMPNLEHRLSRKATQYLHEIWPEYKDLKIEIKDNTKEFIVSVKDIMNIYSFESRSDGFKRFISFLYTISAESKTRNHIILLDEPEGSLHPGGVRHMLKEILEISKKNYCFIATHSIFMIDRKEIDRHIIVTKENESTKIKHATEQNFSQEEVLFQSLGCSMYDMLKPHNIMLEGFIDKAIIKELNDQFKKNDFEYIDFDKCGLCWADGVDKIINHLAIVSGNSVDTFYVSVDNDSQGTDALTNIQEKYPDVKAHTFEELVKSKKSTFTVEDFLSVDWMMEILNKHLHDITMSSTLKFIEKDVSKKKGILESWNIFVEKNCMGKKEELKKGFKNKIPRLIHNKLMSEKITKEKFGYFSNYVTKINKLIK